MTRPSAARSLAFASIMTVVACAETPEPENVTTKTSALFSEIVASPVTGHTALDGRHAMNFRLSGLEGYLEEAWSAAPFGPWGLSAYRVSPYSAPWGLTRSDGFEVIAFPNPDRRVIEAVIKPQPGTFDVDFTQGSNAPRVAVDSPRDDDVIPYVRSDGGQGLVYPGGYPAHVIEIDTTFIGDPYSSYTPVTVATVHDLTSESRATVTVKTGTPFPYVRSDGLNAIVYIGSDNHIHELTNAPHSSTWYDGDLTAASGDWSRPASWLWAYKRSDNVNAVVFINDIGNLREMSLTPGTPCSATHSWCTHPLPAVAPTATLRPSGYVRGDSLNTVIYVSNSNSIHELALLSGVWHDGPLPMPPNITQISEPFAHQPPVDRGSILFRAKNTVTGAANFCEIKLPTTTSWVASCRGEG
jgi:hypothetical protein